jgi:hypothetical protein
MVRARVIEVTGGKAEGRGDYEFVQLPTPGDRATIGNARGDLEMVRVVRIKHLPTNVPPNQFEKRGAMAIVYVEWVEEWNEDV